MNLPGFVQTPDGEAWIAVDRIIAVEYLVDLGHEARVLLDGGITEHLGTWDTTEERDDGVVGWLLAVAMVRCGQGEDASQRYSRTFGVVWGVDG